MNHKNACTRCGTCCRKGGPSFHREDRSLIDEGRIQAKDLFTIRAGEPAHENVQGKVLPVTTDVIKIKGKNNTWECLFLKETENQCGIYPHRPAECRALFCQDTRDIEALHHRRRLTRKDLLQGVAGLWDLIEDHQNRCDYRVLVDLAGKKDSASHKKLLEIVGFDTQIRLLTTQQGGLDPTLTEFLFGRPLTVTLPLMGIPMRPIPSL